ncbi:MAG: NAD+ synthase [Bacteroidota bacterium]|nr:NAD+ synthase [Bacteroidota bacterium]
MPKIALAQINPHVGNIKANLDKIISYTQQAKKQGASLVVFPELAICGYPPLDLLYFDDFIKSCTDAIAELAASSHEIGIIVGGPSVNPIAEGKDLFNSAFYLYKGKIQQVVHKTLLPTYDVFDEYRYFEPNKSFSTIEHDGVKIALTICEDIWNLTDDPLYTQNPMSQLQDAHLMVNISASPFSYKQLHARTEILQANVLKYKMPMVYVNQCGAQTELIFDGGSMVIATNGNQLLKSDAFEESLVTISLSDLLKNPVETCSTDKENEYELIHDALILGIRDYFQKSGFTKGILGLSGGVDSALVLYLASKALGPQNVLPVLLPSQYSSAHSISDSEQLCDNMGIQFKTIGISDIFDNFVETLQPHFENKAANIAEENIQSRIRGVLLMALSNKHGHILLNTSNKSELAVGYGTLYGDMCGGLSVIGDLYKTKVYELCLYINRDQEIIPSNILTKAPSAELRPDQKDSDSLPDYDLLDAILQLYCEENQSARQIIEQGFDSETVNRTLHLVNNSEYKRKQTPPILRVSPRAFGIGRFLPIVASYNL